MRFSHFIVPVFTLYLLSACAPDGDRLNQSASEAPEAARTPRLILKLRDPALDPARPEVLHDLSRQAGLSLIYLRAMSGGAHVLQIGGAPDPEQIDAGLRRLRESPAVDSVEPDRTMRHQPLP